ncbi:START domain-containing protein [Vibrio sp. D404a]|uniref:START domain-containing protein n=1 Tax=unclassified Vibrio TaxID=2614977 RepID=UPI00255429FD|nr:MULTISPECIES: START domain-containing protein [unclassified Vibrio]MDK9738744.1 START domain-containing protein [Vibrio sp. D404a]MDK9798481.1 START domain-containing protein [Vibrio sp. D449a]
MRLARILVFGLCLFSTLTHATPWQFVKSEDGIIIHKRDHGNGLVEVRAQMQVETSYSGFLLLLEDSENVPNWIDNVSHSEVLMQISDNENIVYTQFKAPWPARNRDMVTYSKYEEQEGQFTLTIKDASNYLAKESGYIRIRDVDAIWTLQPLTNGFTHINYAAYANAGGILPDWLMNRLSAKNAFSTFQKLKKQLPKYQGKQHPNLSQ